MKKIFTNIKGYIEYITRHDPIVLLGTFCRLFVYFSCFVNIFLRKQYLLGFLFIVINILSTGITILGYKISQGNSILEKRLFASKLLNEIDIDNKELSNEEKIKRLNGFIEALRYVIKQAEDEINSLKDNNDSKK